MSIQKSLDLPPFVLRRFAKDVPLPITIFESTQNLGEYEIDLFQHQLQLVQSFSSKARVMWPLFLKAIEEHGGPDQMVEAQMALKQQLIEYIQSSEKYQNFLKADFTDAKKIPKKGTSPYTVDNVGKRFLSFDFVSANFQALWLFHAGIFDYAMHWEDFVGKFSDTEYFRRLRMLRQVVFGKLNTKKIVQYQRHLASWFDEIVVEYFGENRYSLSHDEVIVWGDEESLPATEATLRRAEDICRYMNEEHQLNVRVTWFDLEAYTSNHKGTYFVRRHIDPYEPHTPDRFKEVDFRGVNKHLYPQFARFIREENVQEADLYFRFEGSLAKFVQPIVFEKVSFQ